MPYIDQESRARLAGGSAPQNVGELNYAITGMFYAYLGRNGLNYSNLNACVGVLECAKLELYRRLAVPYEDIKLSENGDVF